MEFFERAHVSRQKQTIKKDTKSEESVKKQLKQMLYGYKCSDNKLIKRSDIHNYVDDSSSVSGYSDLNLTNSSKDGDSSINTANTTTNDNSISERSLPSISESHDIENIDEANDLLNDSLSSNNMDSISEKVHNDQSSSIDEYVVSSDEEKSSSVSVESDTTDTFDPSGVLAQKILLNLKEKSRSNESMKRRLDIESNEVINKNIKVKSKSKKSKPKKKPDFKVEEISNTKDSSSQEDSLELAYISDNSQDTTNTAPFETMEVSDVPLKGFSEIIGDYRHSTITEIPYANDNIFSKNTSHIFSTKDIFMNSAEINIQEDSLIPEVASQDSLDSNDIAIKDLSLVSESDSLNKFDISSEVQVNNKCFDSVDDDIESTESISEHVNPVNIFFTKKGCVFILKHPCQIFIHGKVKVKALCGTIEVSGYTLQNEFCDLYAPTYSYAQCLKTIENPNEHSANLFGKLTAEGISVCNAEEIVTSLEENDGVIYLQSMQNSAMDFVENNFSTVELFSKPAKHIDNLLWKASKFLGCSMYLSRPAKVFEESPIWEEVLECGLNELSRGIVCGGKGTGKSTFLRYYVNRLLANSPVLVIDLDPGQAEFTVAGNISATLVTKPLLGPNFTHLQQPEMVLNLGMINTMDNTRRYAAAVTSLITYCSQQQRFRGIPWIVNTMGMCNVMGLKFITFIIYHTRPTFLLQIDSKNWKKRFEFKLDPQTVERLVTNYQRDRLFKFVSPTNLSYKFFISLHTESSGRNNSLAPRDERYLNFLAYFGQLSIQTCGLLDIVPYEINIKDINIAVNVKITEELLTKMINGKVVALCQHGDNGGKLFDLTDKPLLCHGQGLIRGTDWEKGFLYVITPVPLNVLSSVNTIVYSDWVPELRGQEKHLPDGVAIPYRTATEYQQRKLMFTPRRRFNPLQLLKMTRNS